MQILKMSFTLAVCFTLARQSSIADIHQEVRISLVIPVVPIRLHCSESAATAVATPAAAASTSYLGLGWAVMVRTQAVNLFRKVGGKGVRINVTTLLI